MEGQGARRAAGKPRRVLALAGSCIRGADADRLVVGRASWKGRPFVWWSSRPGRHVRCRRPGRSRRERAHANDRSEEHTSELQSLMRTSYAVFCLKKKKVNQPYTVYY